MRNYTNSFTFVHNEFILNKNSHLTNVKFALGIFLLQVVCQRKMYGEVFLSFWRYYLQQCTKYSTDQMQGIRLVVFARRGKRTCTLRQIRTCLYIVKWVYTRRRTRLHKKANMFALYLVSDLYCTYIVLSTTFR